MLFLCRVLSRLYGALSTVRYESLYSRLSDVLPAVWSSSGFGRMLTYARGVLRLTSHRFVVRGITAERPWPLQVFVSKLVVLVSGFLGRE